MLPVLVQNGRRRVSKRFLFNFCVPAIDDVYDICTMFTRARTIYLGLLKVNNCRIPTVTRPERGLLTFGGGDARRRGCSSAGMLVVLLRDKNQSRIWYCLGCQRRNS